MIATTKAREVYICSGATLYPVTFDILDTSDIVVTRYLDGISTVLIEGVGYTVQTVAGPAYNVITTDTYSDGKLTLSRETPYTQPVDVPESGVFPGATQERALDRGTVLAQQNLDALSRSLKSVISDDPTIDLELPISTERALKWLAFDADGRVSMAEGYPSVTPVTSYMAGLLAIDNGVESREYLGNYDLIINSNAKLALLANGSGIEYKSVLIEAGSFEITEQIDLDDHGVQRIEGRGAGSIIDLAYAHSGIGDPMIKAGASLSTVRDFQVISSILQTVYGFVIDLTPVTTKCQVENIRIDGFDDILDGITSGNLKEVTIEGCYVKDCKTGFFEVNQLNSAISDDCTIGFDSCFRLAASMATACGKGFFQSDDIAACRALSSITIGFDDCERISGSSVYDSGGVGFSNCREISSSSSKGNAGSGFSQCKDVSGCFSESNTSHGFILIDQISGCTADDNGGSGFSSCDNMSGCDARNNTVDGFASCEQIAGCFSFTNVDGFSSCNQLSACEAKSNTGDGFSSCDRIAGCSAISNVGTGMISCTYISATYSSSNGTNWATCTFIDFESTNCDQQWPYLSLAIASGGTLVPRGYYQFIKTAAANADIETYDGSGWIITGAITTVSSPNTGGLIFADGVNTRIKSSIANDTVYFRKKP